MEGNRVALLTGIALVVIGALAAMLAVGGRAGATGADLLAGAILLVFAVLGVFVTYILAMSAVEAAAARQVMQQSGPVLPPADLRAMLANPDFDLILEGLQTPALLVRDARVVATNQAANDLLGHHILGADVRTALRHPAAIDRITDADGAQQPSQTVLVGLGHSEQRWLMRTVPLSEQAHFVLLTDQSALARAERMRSDFVANASHELRTPLAAVLGFIETLLDDVAGNDRAVRRRFLGVIDAEARRMQRLVDDLMSLSRIEAVKFQPPEVAVDLALLARQVVADLKPVHGARAGDIQLQLAAGLPPVLADAPQLSQVLHNIIINAMKYGHAGTPVIVSLDRQGKMVVLRVADQGDGIAEEHLPRLTERFYRVDSARSRAMGGTGLGLSIVKHIVERHRGRLDIASTPGSGTTVTVYLPAAAEAATPEKEAVQSAV